MFPNGATFTKMPEPVYIVGCYTCDGSMQPAWYHYSYDGFPICLPDRRNARVINHIHTAIQLMTEMLNLGMERVFIEDITSEMEKFNYG